MRDGIYDVTNDKFSAGFALRGDEVVWCAPILRKRIDHWKAVAEYVGPLPPNLGYSVTNDLLNGGVMSTEPVVIEAPKATLFVERKVSPKQYESLTVGLHLPVELPAFGAEDTPASYAAAVGAAVAEGFAVLKVQVYDQLGLEYTDNNGVIVEKVAAKIEGSTVAPRASRPVPNQPERPDQAESGDGFRRCPKCGGGMWDNRNSKTNPKQPDFKCKDKANCDGVIWPPKK